MRHGLISYFKLTIAAAVLLLTAGCNNYQEEVVQTFPNGSPKLAYLLQGKGDKPLIVGERAYYDNGNTRWEKHFSDGKPAGEWLYNYPSGKPFGKVSFDDKHPDGYNYQFWSADGKELAPGKTDSVKVEWLDEHIPAGVSYHYGSESEVYLFYEDYSIRYHGFTLNKQPNGHCTFFYPNGQPQTEAIYADGVLNGLYTVYRDNGVPYYHGAYIGGKRAGTWEFLDENGAVAYTKDFDK
ncbi:MAG: hypothetical protein IJU81_07005 [Bacteroidales bacterium]|nr:hypothetical protein [Bacteroidales bacterium]